MNILAHLTHIAAEAIGANYRAADWVKPNPWKTAPPAPRERTKKAEFEWFGGQPFESQKDANGIDWQVNASAANAKKSGRERDLHDGDRAAFRGGSQGMKWEPKRAAQLKAAWAEGLSVRATVERFRGSDGYGERIVKEHFSAFGRAEGEGE